MFQIQGKVALLIGAARGVGLELLRHLLQHKVKAVAIAEINNEVGKVAVQKLRDEFGQAQIILIQANILQARELESVFADTVRQLNQLDIVINNLGVIDENEIDRWQNINLLTTARSTALAVNIYLPQNKLSSEAIVVNVNATVALSKMSAQIVGRSLAGSMAQIEQEVNNVRVITLFVGSSTPELISGLATNQLVLNVTNVSEPISQPGLQAVGRALINAIQQGISTPVQIGGQQTSIANQLASSLNFDQLVL